MKRKLRSRLETRVPVSVVIPALNEERYLPHLLSSLLACTSQPMEIIVVDGRSDDGTLAVVERYRRMAPAHVTVRGLTSVVRNVSVQRNVGASAARHDVLLFLDADTVVPSSQNLDELLGQFHARRLAAASCRFEPIERAPRALLYFRMLYVFHKVVERWDPYAMGACIVTSHDVFRRCGGFDPSIAVNEDAHYCRKASRLGSFRILPTTIGVSCRRFTKCGYLRMGLQYVGIFARRVLHGEARHGEVEYEFGNHV